MPGVQIAVAEIRQEAEEAGPAAQRKEPPSPGFPGFQREGSQPKVKDPRRNQRSAESHPVVEHEMDDAASLKRAQLLGGHPQELDVVREEMSAQGEEERESAREEEPQSAQRQEGTTVADQGFEQPLLSGVRHALVRSLHRALSKAVLREFRARTSPR